MPTLFDYYKGQGKALPTLQERGQLFEQAGLGKAHEYRGTSEQNTSLLTRLSSGASGSGAAPGTPGGVDPALTGAGNQASDREGAAKVPTAEESRNNQREAYTTKATDPMRSLVERMTKERAALPSSESILREERTRAGIPKLDEEIVATQSVIDNINASLGRTKNFEENRQIPLGLVRGRQRQAELQASTELTPLEIRLGRLEGRRTAANQEASDFAKIREADSRRTLDATEAELEAESKYFQPGRDKLLDAQIKDLDPKKEEKPELRTVGKKIIRINADGTHTVVYDGGGSGSGSDNDVDTTPGDTGAADTLFTEYLKAAEEQAAQTFTPAKRDALRKEFDAAYDAEVGSPVSPDVVKLLSAADKKAMHAQGLDPKKPADASRYIKQEQKKKDDKAAAAKAKSEKSGNSLANDIDKLFSSSK